MLCASSRASPSSPAGVQSPLSTACEEALQRAVAADGGVGAGHEEAAVVVRAADECLAPGGRAERRDALALRHVHDARRREAARPASRSRPLQRRVREPFRASSTLKSSRHFSTMSGGELAGHVEERVREEVWDAAPRAGRRRGRRRRLARLDGVGERRLVDARGHDVHATAVLGEPGVELGAQEGARQVGDGQRPVQRVVIADSDEVHAAGPGEAVDLDRLGVGLLTAEAAAWPVCGAGRSAASGHGGRLCW